MPVRECNFLIVGTGMAGASAAYHLAGGSSVILLERESQPGYHPTGRSAAVYAESYGPRVMGVMTVASGPFLRKPPAGFAEVPLMHPRGALFLAREDQRSALEDLVKELSELSDDLRLVGPEEAFRLCPVLKRGYLALAAQDPTVMDMDVNAIHQGYLRAARAKGAEIATGAEVTALERRGGAWHARTQAVGVSPPRLVKAARARSRRGAGPWRVSKAGAQPG